MSEIHILIDAYRKLFAYARAAEPNEVMGLLSAEEFEDGSILIDDIILPKQKVSGGSCELLIDKTITDIERPEKIKGWWHSHHHMGTFHSWDDDDTLTEKWSGGKKARYAVSIVVSLPSEIKAWIQYYKPVTLKNPVEVPIAIVFEDEEVLEEACKQEVDDKVTVHSWAKGKKIRLRGNKISPPITDLTRQPNIKSVDEILEEIDEKACPNLLNGPHGKPICFFHGQTYDCETCYHNPEHWETGETTEFVVHVSCPHFMGFNKGFMNYECEVKGQIESCIYCKIWGQIQKEIEKEAG